jgi:hypothetical protein
MKSSTEPLRLRASRQRSYQFRSCGVQLVSQTKLGRCAWQRRQKQGFCLGLCQRPQLRSKAIDEFESAVAAAVSDHRNSDRAELVDVAVNRAHRDLELSRHLRRRQPASCLQADYQGNQSAGTHISKVSTHT